MNMFKEDSAPLLFAFEKLIRIVLEQIKVPSRIQLEGTQEKREPSKWQQDWKREDGFFGNLSRDKIRLVLWERVRTTTSRFISGGLARCDVIVMY